MPNELKKITALPDGTPADTDVVPFVDLATNTTKKALKSELKGDKGDAATVDAGTTTTLAAGQSATVTNIGTTSAAIFNFAIPQGIQGITGADGACVESVAFVGNDMVFTLDDASTITLTNAKVDIKGDTGAQVVSAAFVGDDMVFTLDDASTATLTGALTSLKGNQGDPGDAATIAVGTVTTVANGVPASVTNSGTSAAAVFDFEIPKGLDGTGSGDISGTGVANELAYFTAEKTIDNLPVATYPSLTEVSYVKGVTSGIQSQLNGKQASGSYEVTTNKENTTIDTSTTKYPTVNLLKTVKDIADGKMSNPMSDTGDIIYGGASGVATRLAKGDDDKVLMLKSGLPSWETPASGGGSSFWTAVPGSPTRTANTTFTVTDTSNANSYDKLLSRGTCLKWTESSVLKQAMIVSTTYATNTVTVTIIGDTMASIDADSLKYFSEKARIYKWAIAGTIGATGTNLGNTVMCEVPGKIYGSDIWAGTAGNGTTTIDINKGGTTMFTTKPSITTTDKSDLGNTADNGTTTDTGDFLTIDVDAVAATTAIVDLYVNLYYIPLYNSYLE